MSATTVNVSSHLAAMAATDAERVALHCPHARGRTTLTFRELHAESDAIAYGLNAAGITRGTRTVLMVPPSLEFFSLTFALLKVAAVPVMIDPGMGTRNLGTCLADAEPEAFVGIPKAHLARRLLGWGRRTIHTTINVGRWRMSCSRFLAELRELGSASGPYHPPTVAADDTAAILFTSGSTGVAKGAVYSHGIFAAQVDILTRTFGIEPGEIDLCTFPLFALFGPALGMTCVIPDMDASRPGRIDPSMAVDHIRRFGVTNLFGSPAVVRRLAEWGLSAGWRKPGPRPPADADGVHREAPPRLPTLRRVISAGAPASAQNIELFARLLTPGVEVFTPYGATEALPVANIGSREILTETRELTDQGKGVCVGQPVVGMTVHVIPILDEPIAEWDDSLDLPPGEVGEFVVRGPVVTTRYYNRNAATKLAKILDSKTGEVLHRMGDVGYLDDRGRLWFCGRKSHRVETPCGTLFTDQVEPIFNTVPWVFRTALVGIFRGGVNYPVLCYEFQDDPWLIRDDKKHSQALRRLVEKAGEYSHTVSIAAFLRYPGSFPVDVRHNSKIFREKLAVWADRTLGPEWTPAPKAHPLRRVGPEAPA